MRVTVNLNHEKNMKITENIRQHLNRTISITWGVSRGRDTARGTSRHATKRHTVPSIDGACGFSSVCDILRAIGLDLRQVVNRKNLDVYEIILAEKPKRQRLALETTHAAA